MFFHESENSISTVLSTKFFFNSEIEFLRKRLNEFHET